MRSWRVAGGRIGCRPGISPIREIPTREIFGDLTADLAARIELQVRVSD